MRTTRGKRTNRVRDFAMRSRCLLTRMCVLREKCLIFVIISLCNNYSQKDYLCSKCRYSSYTRNSRIECKKLQLKDPIVKLIDIVENEIVTGNVKFSSTMAIFLQTAFMMIFRVSFNGR